MPFARLHKYSIFLRLVLFFVEISSILQVGRAKQTGEAWFVKGSESDSPILGIISFFFQVLILLLVFPSFCTLMPWGFFFVFFFYRKWLVLLLNWNRRIININITWIFFILKLRGPLQVYLRFIKAI